jgi:luciferase-like monooxygenase
MTSTQTPSARIAGEVAGWPGVETVSGKSGELAFRVGRRELGHLHGNHGAHFAFPKEIWLELKEQQRIAAHPVFPDKAGPAVRLIENDADVDDVIDLLRINYDWIVDHPTADEPDTDGPGRPRDLDYGPTAA